MYIKYPNKNQRHMFFLYVNETAIWGGEECDAAARRRAVVASPKIAPGCFRCDVLWNLYTMIGFNGIYQQILSYGIYILW